MATATTTADPITRNTVSDLFNYDVADDDPFKDIDTTIRDTTDDKPTLSPRAAKRKLDEEKENFGLGLDEEVKITKKRKPIAKLDEARLLSQPGIPKLRALARSQQISKKLRLKGKGHEYSDAAKLLNYYQLWLDNLYPRAKFADGLQLVEKVGHSKRMQVMRREWIDEGKPGYARDNKSKDKELVNHDASNTDSERSQPSAQREQADREPSKNVRRSIFGNESDDEDLFFPETNKNTDDGPEEDELDALLVERPVVENQSKTIHAHSDDEDELDALLAEQGSRDSAGKSRETAQQQVTEEDEDDLDALLAEQDSRQGTSNTALQHNPFEEDSDDDLDALLAEQNARLKSHQFAGSPPKHHHADDDDLDALRAEQESRCQSRLERKSKPSTNGKARPISTPQNSPRPSSSQAPDFSSSPLQSISDVDEDSLDALLAEQEVPQQPREAS